jgi:hypothetical protein
LRRFRLAYLLKGSVFTVDDLVHSISTNIPEATEATGAQIKTSASAVR